MSSASLRIGIVCYPTFGGSGVIATEIGMGMAERKHKVHIIATSQPVRMRPHPNVSFHKVNVPSYPLFDSAPYSLALATSIAEVCRQQELDLLHVHYVVPHVVSAYLAKQMLGKEAPPILATLHGTDVTKVGLEESYQPLLKHVLQACDGLTTPSSFLKQTATETFVLPPESSIHVIPNFVDTDVFAPSTKVDAKRNKLQHLFPNDDEAFDSPLLVHVSNFRPVKRVLDVVETFARVHQQHPARLLLLGEGPDRLKAIARIEELDLTSKVRWLDNHTNVLEHLQCSDVMLLPSETESFGLAALEALSCGVPVVASDVGGLPELIQHGVTGYLEPVGDVERMAEAVLRLIQDPSRHQRFSDAARHDAIDRWKQQHVLDQYEAFFRSHLSLVT